MLGRPRSAHPARPRSRGGSPLWAVPRLRGPAFLRAPYSVTWHYKMPPRKSRKAAVGSQLPGGSELEALAWGHHMAQTAKWRGVAEEIRDFTNNASLGLLSGTGRAEWALYNPTLGVGVPLSRAQALSLTPAEVLQHHFGEAEAGRQRGPPQAFNAGSSKHASTALVHMTGGAGGRHGEVPIVVGTGGQSLLKAQGM